MNQKKIFFYLSLIAALFITACSDNPGPIDDEEDESGTEYLYILSEGSHEQNNSTLALYNIETDEVNKDYFRTVNQRGIGDTGNDMILYGSKIYVSVHISSSIEVLDAASGRSLSQIDMKQTDGSAKQPRQLAAHDGKVYVTSYDDTVTRIDTISLQIDNSLEVGLDPEGIVIKNSKIYVANSGGLNFMDGYDNTVSVIDALTFTEEKRIEVGVNPANLQADSQGNIYVSVLGNYFDIPSTFKQINPVNGTVTTIGEIENPDRFVIWNNKAYIISGSYGNPYTVIVYDLQEKKVVRDHFVTDGTSLDIIYNIAVDETTGDVFLMETDYITPGSVYCFNQEGKLKYSIPAVGMNPTAVVVQR